MNLLDKIFNRQVHTNAGKSTAAKAQPALKDSVNKANQGVILFNDSDVQHILNKSGKHAKSNEYQVHYWGLILRYRAPDKSILDICIPTVFFNYKQQVSTAHIDFELSDVDDTSDAVLPVHEMKVKEILDSSFKSDIEKHFGITLEPLSVAINSLHCHPGTSTNQSFSGTDLSKRSEDLGVVFPLAEAEDDRPNFAGIMVRKSASNNVLAHYEYRTANGKLNENMQYVQGKCAALISKESTKKSFVASMFGEIDKSNNYSVMKGCKMNEHFEEIQAAFDQINFTAFTDTVQPDNVELKTYVSQVKTRSSSTFKKTESPLQGKFVMEVGVTIEDYQASEAIVEQFKSFEPADMKTLNNSGIKELVEYYNKWHLELYSKEDDDLYVVLADMPADEMKEELVFECLSLIDSIKDHVSECKDTVDLYNQEQKTISKEDPFSTKQVENFDLEQEILMQMREELIASGFSVGVIAMKTNDEIEDIYKFFKQNKVVV